MKYEILLELIYWLEDVGLFDYADWYYCQLVAQEAGRPAVTYTKFIGEN